MVEIPEGILKPAAESAAKVIALAALVFVAGFETCRAVAPKEANAQGSMIERGAELIPRLVRMEETINNIERHLAVVEARVDDLRAHDSDKPSRR